VVEQRRSGLGKGLAALLPTENIGTVGESPTTGAYLREVPLGNISPNPNQPRGRFDEEGLVELAHSIRELGVLQPILVRPMPDGQFQLIAGERRWRAAKRCGLDSIPCVVRTTDDVASVEQALVENLHRQDLTALEEAAAYLQLIEEFHLTHEELAKKVAKSRAAISNTLRLLQLPASIQHLLSDGRISAGHARALLGTPDRSFQEALAHRIVEEGLSVRLVEELIRRPHQPVETPQSENHPRAHEGPIRQLRPPGLLELEELLSEHLDTRVSVSMGGKRGKMVIEFATLEDLERIYRVMTEPQASDGAQRSG
jgi:ParB family transcriptional regulator, chromosome partitioning protein